MSTVTQPTAAELAQTLVASTAAALDVAEAINATAQLLCFTTNFKYGMDSSFNTDVKEASRITYENTLALRIVHANAVAAAEALQAA